MTGRQQLVFRSLEERSSEMAELYKCAMHIFQDAVNPCRLFLTTHAIREMIKGLPSVLDLPILAKQERLGDKVDALDPVWNRALRGSCHQDGRWSGQIDGPLQRFLDALQEFFQWWKESRPRRRTVATALFRRTDPAGFTLPEPLERQRADRWLALHDYFTRAAHRAPTTEVDFQVHLHELEQILLDSLRRQPSEDLSAIDAILAEEAPDA